jgi:tocopherol O-methyltransferase
MSTDDIDVEAIRAHYDRVSPYYRAFWGEHIHHGYWEDGESPAAAQVKLVERLAAQAHIPWGAHVLDVGCGLGGSALWLVRHLGCRVLGITISPVQAAMARERARAEGLAERVCFEVMDANRLTLPPERFDAVWVIECSEHLADKRRFLAACACLLRPSGVLALCAWLVAEDLRSMAQARLIAEVASGMLCPSLASKRDYVRWMRASGFAHIEAEDLTRRVEPTWVYCTALARHPAVRALLRASDVRLQRFVATFEAMCRAYAEGAMAYGLFTARKP